MTTLPEREGTDPGGEGKLRPSESRSVAAAEFTEPKL